MRDLTPDDVGHLATGAHVLACCIDPTSIYIHLEMIQLAMQEREVQVASLSDLHPDELVVAVGVVTQGLFFADMPPVGDEFLGCIDAMEAKLGRPISGVFSLAAANVNGIIPLMVGLQASLPIIDADPMGRVFPLISQTTLAIVQMRISPVVMMGMTGERAMVEADDPQRVETLVRGLVTELGGWSATAMYPCRVADLAAHGVPGSISRMIRIGEILEGDGSIEGKFLELVEYLNARRIARARVSHIDGFSGPIDPGLPAQPSSLTLVDEATGRIIRVEIQNEILLVLADGAVVAAVPDIVTMLDPESGSVASLDDLRVGLVLDVIAIPAAAQWYSPAGLALAGPRAFRIPLDHPRHHG